MEGSTSDKYKPEAATMPVNTSRVENSSEDINISSNIYDAILTTEKPKILAESNRDRKDMWIFPSGYITNAMVLHVLDI